MNVVNNLFQSLRRSSTVFSGLIVAVGTAGIALTASAQEQEDAEFLPKEAKREVQEAGEVLKAPEPDARRIYIGDQRAFEVFTQHLVVDGNTGKYLGTIDSGLLPNPVVAPDGSEFYLADTKYSRYSHGERDDLIRIYDPRTLSQTGEIDIPEGRFLVMTKDSMTSTTPDGRYLIFYQFAPTNAIGIVDLEKKEFLNTIKTPNCYYAFPAQDRRVVLHCRDASLLQVTFDEKGNKASESTTKPFHEPVKEATFDNPAFDRKSGKIFFVSYAGKVFPVDISGKEPSAGESWDLLTSEEREEGWLPGGWQVATYHHASERLFVLMDVRADTAKNTESNEVWVYDTTNGERVNKIHLAHEARSIRVDHADEPYLYALSEHAANLTIYNADTGAVRSSVDELGAFPNIIATSDGR